MTLAFFIIALAGCNNASRDDDDRLTDATTTGPRSSDISADTSNDGEITTTTAATDDAAPGIVGTWTSSDDLIEIVYRFHDDGSYESALVMTQPVPSGVSSFEVAVAGSYTIEGEDLVLVPTRGHERRQDPGDPAGDYDRPIDTTPQRHGWSLASGSSDGDVLTLVTPEGVTLTFERL